jgi:HEAT repeat protein
MGLFGFGKPNVKELEQKHDIDGLIKALENKSLEVRYDAVQALGRIGDARAVTPLCAALKDPYIEVRMAAADVLGKMGDARAVEPLVNQLTKEKFSRASEDAAKALIKIGTPAVSTLITGLGESDWNVLSTVICVLGRIKDARAVEPLITMYRNSFNSYRPDYAIMLKGKIHLALLQIGTSSVDPMINALKDPNWWVREIAAETLRDLYDVRALDPLTAVLNDSDNRVREAATAALKELKKQC